MPQTNWIKNQGKSNQRQILLFRLAKIVPTYYLGPYRGTDRGNKTKIFKHISFTNPLYYLITFPLYFLYTFNIQYITNEVIISKEKHKQLVKHLVINLPLYCPPLSSILKSFFIYRYMPTQYCIT